MWRRFGRALLLASLALMLSCSGAEVVVFRCPGCTAEQQAACPKPPESDSCAELVREPGCGCCPVCARKLGEFCGVYTARCATGLRCAPNRDLDMPLDQLVRGHGTCEVRTDSTDAFEEREIEPDYGEPFGTRPPPQKRPNKDVWQMKETMAKHYQNEQKARMMNRVEEPKVPRPKQSQCQQELDKVLDEISRMTFLDNKGPLENLYDLNFPNCDNRGQYNIKQCHMSTHGQRGECWCVNPHTGVQIPSSVRVRGDPNCSQYFGGPELQPPASLYA
ncbi:insulin-like growth factor-binding protein 2-B [Trichomycterus rosablanca]|uniref:insulin-like growth factor-binding protein 2-B n=1 Tax=Trichomycterus rosablanca TaxID=2290929 RepID=UPI002F35602B